MEPDEATKSVDRHLVIMNPITSRAYSFIKARNTGRIGEFTFCPGGRVSLYASCYAALALRVIGQLEELTEAQRESWCDYINAWQDEETGYYEGPELAPREFTRSDLNETYFRLHLISHVLPALNLLGGEPAYPLSFAREFVDKNHLRKWLEDRDWSRAWKEGNNLLFVGQLLVHLRDSEGEQRAQEALSYFFDWLDGQQDPHTGLWGTDGYCDAYEAVYGGYHQLLVYYYCQRKVPHAEQIIDTVLSLQHPDGSFSRVPGGGACEDLDAIDVLVNLTKRTGYRIEDVQRALRWSLKHILNQQTTDGGFVFRWERSRVDSGMLRTYVPANTADLFATWFRLHALALINEMVIAPVLEGTHWRFNRTCSMGWHDTSIEIGRSVVAGAHIDASPSEGATKQRRLEGSDGRSEGNILHRIVRRIPRRWILRVFDTLVRRYAHVLAPETRLELLSGLDGIIDSLGEKSAREAKNGLPVEFWWSQKYRFFVDYLSSQSKVLHLGCREGSLSYTLAALAGVDVIATDSDGVGASERGKRYRHPNLTFVDPDEVTVSRFQIDSIVMTDFEDGVPDWNRWWDCWQEYAGVEVLAQLSSDPKNWRDLHSTIDYDTFDRFLGQISLPPGWEIVDLIIEHGTFFGRLEKKSISQDEE
jgi:hypothetical protein